MKIKRENFFVIQGFMINELNLKGNELLVYALIYGFSQTENQYFTGSLSYLAAWINSSKPTVIKILNSLVEKKLLIKEDVIKNNVKYCKYKAVIKTTEKNKETFKNNLGGKEILPEGSKETLVGGKENELGIVKRLNWGGKETLPNNINNNILDNINNINNNCCNKLQQQNLGREFENELDEKFNMQKYLEIWNNNSEYLIDSKKNKNIILDYIKSLNIGEDYKNKLIEFYDYRKKIRKTIKTTKAIDFILNQKFVNEKHAIACIDFAMGNEYIGVKAEYIDYNKFSVDEEEEEPAFIEIKF